MYAVIDDKGKQYKVQEGQRFKIDRIEEDSGELVFDKVLLISGDSVESIIGKPYINNAKVKCEIVGEVKGKKILVLKYKKKKNYKRRKGHRQKYTELLVKEIVKGG